MPVKKRTRKQRNHRITPEAVDLFKQCSDISESQREAWEDEGGRRREYLDKSLALEAALDLRPHEMSPLDSGPEPPSYGHGTGYYQSWPQAYELRRQIIRATRSQDTE